jgi:hypothetical protein
MRTFSCGHRSSKLVRPAARGFTAPWLAAAKVALQNCPKGEDTAQIVGKAHRSVRLVPGPTGVLVLANPTPLIPEFH